MIVLREGALLASGGWRPGVLLNIPQCTGRSSPQRRIWAQVSAARKHSLGPSAFLSARPEADPTRGLIHPVILCGIGPPAVPLLPWIPASAPALPRAALPTQGPPTTSPNILGKPLGAQKQPVIRVLPPCSCPGGTTLRGSQPSASRPHGVLSSILLPVSL